MTDTPTQSAEPEHGFEFSDEPLAWPLVGLTQAERTARLEPALRQLTEHHMKSCAPFGNIANAMFSGWRERPGLAEIPFLPVGIFKQRDLASFAGPPFKTLTSSGTTGASVSRVMLDRQTSQRQTKALSITMQEVLGSGRRPMLIVDAEATVKNRSIFSARSAGVVGMMQFGRKHKFLLNDDMTVDHETLQEFLGSVGDQKPVMFGFTFMVWQHLYQPLKDAGVDLSEATLIHSGGWKKLVEQSVDNATFKKSLHDSFNITEVVNFYGMAEQVGSVFVEGTDGLLHCSPFSDVIMRDPRTWEEVPLGEEGVVQVLSAVPTGYPGQSILTEDVGVVETIDSPDTPHLGKAFRIVGRVPKSELRGCSDTYAQAVA